MNHVKKYAACLILSALICLIPGETAMAKAPAILPAAAKTFLETQEAALKHAGLFGQRALSAVIKQISGCLVGRTIEELLADSTVIATGRIVGGPHSFILEHASIPDYFAYYSYYDFAIDTVWKGEPYAETVSVRIPGGVVDGVGEHYSGTPCFNQEDEYLLFLLNEGIGGPFNTQDDYYGLFGLVQGAYARNEEDVYINVASGEELPGEALISPHLDEEPDADYYRSQWEAQYLLKYETGDATKEEYEELIDELDRYATVVKRAS